MSSNHRIRPFHVACLLLVLTAGYFRVSGLHRGLTDNTIAHPDARKQMLMLEHYLHGNAVAYQGNLFYDGYPYGLNRVDELLIRAGRWIGEPLRARLASRPVDKAVPSRHELFFWALSLRAIYGLAAMGLVFGAVWRFGRNRWAALAAAALAGLAPLASTVSHSATGDIGVDLFIAAALYSAAAYAENGRCRWLAALGLACGMAYACKYQGFLGLWLGGIPLLLGLADGPRRLARLLRGAATMAAGFAAGVLALVPGFFVDPEKTWRFMRLNFSFLKNYGVSREFLEQPFFTRMHWGLGHNVPFIIQCIGYGFMLLGFLALVLAIRSGWRAFRAAAANPDAERTPRRRAAVFAAAASFPWMALFLATALKPAVQPFHFSFLIPALAVACGMGWLSLPVSAGRGVRMALGALFVLALVELVVGSRREDFFWRRPEIHLSGAAYSRAVFGTDAHGTREHVGSRIIKQFYAEPATLPVFRSRPCGLKHPRADWWNRRVQLPVPAVPFPGAGHWIFMNGPVFPRNDRMFPVPASGTGMFDRPGYAGEPLLRSTLGRGGGWTERTLVFNRRPDGVQIGLRTGRWPSRYEICASGEKTIRGFLPPHSQILLPLPRLQARVAFAGRGPKKPESHLVTLRLRARLGPVWATVLAGPEEEARYRRHGPFSPDAAPIDADAGWNDPVFLEQLGALRFVDGTAPLEVIEKPKPLPGGENPLEAGAYILTALVRNPDMPRKLRFEMIDLSGLAHAIPALEAVVPAGDHEISWRFAKDFAPYDPAPFVSADGPGTTVLSWELRPDADALKNWQPAPPAAAGPANTAEHLLGVRYPGIGTWRGFLAPDEIPAGQPFSYAVRFDLEESISPRVFHEDRIFLHLWNAAGERVATLDYPLNQASFTAGPINWQQAGPLPPGAYTLEGGIYNPRTGLRKRFQAPDSVLANPKRRYFYVREIVAVPAAGGKTPARSP